MAKILPYGKNIEFVWKRKTIISKNGKNETNVDEYNYKSRRDELM
jgi:hypothetical protein